MLSTKYTHFTILTVHSGDRYRDISDWDRCLSSNFLPPAWVLSFQVSLRLAKQSDGHRPRCTTWATSTGRFLTSSIAGSDCSAVFAFRDRTFISLWIRESRENLSNIRIGAILLSSRYKWLSPHKILPAPEPWFQVDIVQPNPQRQNDSETGIRWNQSRYKQANQHTRIHSYRAWMNFVICDNLWWLY